MMKPVSIHQAWLRARVKEAAEIIPNPRHIKLIFKNKKLNFFKKKSKGKGLSEGKSRI